MKLRYFSQRMVIYTFLCTLPALLYELDKIDEIWETTTKFSRCECMSNIGDNYYLEAATGGIL